MRMHFETGELRLTWSADGGAVVQLGGAAQALDGAQIRALCEALDVTTRLSGIGAVTAAPAVAISPATSPAPVAVEAKTAPPVEVPAAAAAPAAPATGASPAFGTSHRDAGLLLLDGEAVKRGPKATAERAGPRKGRRRGRPPGKGRATNKSAATGTTTPAAAASPKTATPKPRGPLPAANRRGRGRPRGGRSGRSRKPIVDSMATWMRNNSGAHGIDALVNAAEDGGWTAAKEVAPAIRAALSRNADLFARQGDGSFVLRATLPPGKVVRRRRKSRSE